MPQRGQLHLCLQAWPPCRKDVLECCSIYIERYRFIKLHAYYVQVVEDWLTLGPELENITTPLPTTTTTTTTTTPGVNTQIPDPIERHPDQNVFGQSYVQDLTGIVCSLNILVLLD